MSPEKKKKKTSSLDKALAEYTKSTDRTQFLPVVPVLDPILGGGLPMGKISMLYGPPGSGKTTLLLNMLAAIQARGEEAIYIDVEHCLDVDYAEYIGLDLDKLHICQPESGEEVIEILHIAMDEGAEFVGLDSVGGLVTQAEMDGSNASAPIARLLAKELRGIIQKATISKTVLFFINQMRKKVGSMGSDENLTGGEALKYFSSVHLDMRRVAWIKRTENKEASVIGFKSRIRATKNRFYPPYRDIYFNATFDPSAPDYGEIENMISLGMIKKLGGGNYQYKDKKFKARDFAEMEIEYE